VKSCRRNGRHFTSAGWTSLPRHALGPLRLPLQSTSLIIDAAEAAVWVGGADPPSDASALAWPPLRCGHRESLANRNRNGLFRGRESGTDDPCVGVLRKARTRPFYQGLGIR